MSRIALCSLVEEEVLENEAGPLTEADIVEGEIELQQRQEEASLDSVDIGQSLEALESICLKREAILAREDVSEADLKSFKISIEEMVSVMGLDGKKLFPSLESYSNPRVAVEETGDRIEQALGSIGNRIKDTITAAGETARFLITFYSKQVTAIDNVVNQLSHLDKKQVVRVSTRATASVRYGEQGKVVKSGKEFAELSKDSCETLIGLLGALRVFTEKDFLSNIKVAFLFLGNKTYKRQFLRLEELAHSISKLPGMKKTATDTPHLSNFESDVKLGMYKLWADLPEKDSYERDPNYLKDVASQFSIRILKSNAREHIDGPVEFDITVGEIIDVLSHAKNLAYQMKAFNSVVVKLSTLGAFTNTVGLVSSTIMQAGTNLFMFIFSNFRMLYKISHAITYMNGHAYNTSKSLVAKTLEIANGAKK